MSGHTWSGISALLLVFCFHGGLMGATAGEEVPPLGSTQELAVEAGDLAHAEGMNAATPDRGEAVARALSELRTLDEHLGATPTDLEAHLQRVRLLYFLSIDQGRFLDRTAGAIDEARPHISGDTESRRIGIALEGYAAALEVLRGKHAVWPPSKLGHLRKGLERLDEEVEQHSDHAELRYLRLVSGFYLPRVFGRQDRVREDLVMLERRLPEVVEDFPPSTFAGMASFTLEHGPSGAEVHRPLLRALQKVEREMPDV